MLLLEKYVLQNKQQEINSLAKEIYDKVIPIAKSLYLLNETSDYSMEIKRLYNLVDNGNKDAKYIIDIDNYLNEEDEAVVFRKIIKDIAPKPIYVRAFITGYDTSQTGGFDPDDSTVSVYFPYKQYENKTNNFDLNRLKKTLMHELTHAVDYMNNYYTTKARRVIPSTIPEKDRKVINKVNPYIYDVLYRLWNDSEMNAQQITITEDLINSIKEGIDALKNLDSRHEVFSILRQVVPPTRENISDTRFKVWIISNSEKRLNKLISKKNKNDTRLSN